MVPLKWAWEHGAYNWSAAKRKQFANDEVNLFAVEDSVNQAKGAKGPLEWLPPNKGFHCQYILRFIRVVKTYRMVLSDYEKNEFEVLKIGECEN